MPKFILASASPRRRTLLNQLGVNFEVCPSKINEAQVKTKDPQELVEKLSYLKADEVNKRKNGIIIGADTVVSLDNKILEKPVTEREAYNMLRKLADSVHQVITGVTIIKRDKLLTDYCQTEVKFRKLADKEIYQYINTGEPMDKAGAYGIQGKGAVFVQEIKGCFYNVMGLPLTKLITMLKELEIEVKLD